MRDEIARTFRWFLATVEFATDVRTIRNVQTEADDRCIERFGMRAASARLSMSR